MALLEAVPLLAALLALPLPASYPPLTLTPQRQRQKTLETLLAWLYAEAQRHPVLVIVEDLHWVDPSTLELLSLLIDQSAQARCCLVLTTRPEFHPPWAMVAHLTSLTLRRLAPAQIERLATQVAGDKALPPAVLQEVVRKTDGVPLFVEELTKTVLESGLLDEQADHYELPGPLPPLAIPATLHDALMARLDRLAAVKVVAQLGAVIGRTFAYDLVQAVAALDEATLQSALVQLVEAELVTHRGLPPQATYTFKHALIQDAAYQSLLRSTRQQYHQRLAQVLEVRFPDLVETEPELVAHHYTEAGCPAQAIPYWQRAGQQASQRSAHQEAIGHLTKGVAVLQTLPDTPERTQQDLVLHVALVQSLVAVQGSAAPEVERVYTRARALCQQVGDTPQLFPVLRGLSRVSVWRGHMQTAQDLAEQLLRQAERQPEVAPRLAGHEALATALFHRAAFGDAARHFAQAIAASHLQEHGQLAHGYVTDPGTGARGVGALVLWLLGYPDRALAQGQEALTLAQEGGLPYGQMFAQLWLACLHQFRQEAHVAHDRAAVSLGLAAQQGFATTYVAWGNVLQGWALTRQEQRAAGMAKMQQGIEAYAATGAEVLRPYFLALLAEAHGTAGQPEEGLRVLAEAQAVLARTDDRFYEAEISRLAGVLHLAHSPTAQADAEGHMRHALDVARRQQARSWELRVATSLARLWQQQGKQAEARELLASVYGWFTEGFDTADLQEAKALLDVLA